MTIDEAKNLKAGDKLETVSKETFTQGQKWFLSEPKDSKSVSLKVQTDRPVIRY
jgi:hypothetical protein